MNKPLTDVLKIYEKGVDDINAKIEMERKLFLTAFFDLRSDLNRDYEIIDRIKLSDGALIILWVPRGNKKYGPYWYRCRYFKFKQESQGKKGEYRYDYIGAALGKREMNRFAGAESENKWKYARDVANWSEYERYDRRINDLRAERQRLTGEIKRVKGLMRYGKTVLDTKNKVGKSRTKGGQYAY